MQCRERCGACCIAPSIARPFHGMPRGKPAGVACVHLDAQKRCALYGDPRRPAVCDAFKAERPVCGTSREEALQILSVLERASSPDTPHGATPC